MKQPLFVGTAAAMVTPFTETGVDLPSLQQHAHRLITAGVNALVVCGTTGEASTMSRRERASAIEAVVSASAGTVPVIAGTGANCTETAIILSKDAEKAGADGLLCVTPYYNKASKTGLIRHYEAIADAVNLPMILYNVPSRTGVHCTAEIYAALASHPNIVGVKEASGDQGLIQETLCTCPADFCVWSGNDSETVAAMALGGKGVISVTANILPHYVVHMTDLCLNGSYAEAGQQQLLLREINDAMFMDVNPIPVKTAMACLGWCQELFRLPLCPLDKDRREKLVTVLQHYHLIKK